MCQLSVHVLSWLEFYLSQTVSVHVCALVGTHAGAAIFVQIGAEKISEN